MIYTARMSDDGSKRRDDELPRRNDKPIFITKDIKPGQMLKKSRYCQHGNVWGRCPQGC